MRRWDVLWAVYEWGLRFMQLQKRRAVRYTAYNLLMDKELPEEDKDLVSDCARAANTADSMAALDDVDVKFKTLLEAATVNEVGAEGVVVIADSVAVAVGYLCSLFICLLQL